MHDFFEFASQHYITALFMTWCVVGGGYQTIRVLLRGWPPSMSEDKK